MPGAGDVLPSAAKEAAASAMSWVTARRDLSSKHASRRWLQGVRYGRECGGREARAVCCTCRSSLQNEAAAAGLLIGVLCDSKVMLCDFKSADVSEHVNRCVAVLFSHAAM